MVKKTLTREIIDISKSFKSFLEKENFPVDFLVVFGSHAKGTAREGSDIDICVVSPAFGHNDVLEMQMLFKKARRVDSRIEPYPVNSDSFKETWNPIINEINTWGVKI